MIELKKRIKVLIEIEGIQKEVNERINEQEKGLLIVKGIFEVIIEVDLNNRIKEIEGFLEVFNVYLQGIKEQINY